MHRHSFHRRSLDSKECHNGKAKPFRTEGGGAALNPKTNLTPYQSNPCWALVELTVAG